MRTRRLIAAAGLAAALASSATASASTAPYSISDIDPAPAAAFKVSDIGASLTPGYVTPADSDHSQAAPEDLYKISNISPR